MDSLDLINLQENKNVELKNANDRLPNDIWPTISAFSNTSGGKIYLGIDEGKKNKDRIVGVSRPDILIANFLNDLRNTNKINRPVIDEDDIKIIDFEDKHVIEITVNESSRERKPTYIKGNLSNSYIRTGDGDRLLTNGELQGFLLDNSTSHFDIQPNIKGYDFDTIDKDTLNLFRGELEARSPAYIYKDNDDYSFLSKLGCLTTNDKGHKVLTNAAVLFFTSYPLINSLFPDFYLDYREAPNWSSKWTNRIVCDDLTWSGNLFDFFEKVSKRICSTLPKPYVLDNGVDVGARHIQEIVREALANALSNVSVLLPGGITILNDGTNIIIRNSGRMIVGLKQAIEGGRSMPRNESILLLLRTLGVADRAGTGIPKIIQLMQRDGFPEPVLQEGTDPESTTLTLVFKAKNRFGNSKVDISLKIREFIRSKGKIGASKKEIINQFSLGSTTATKLLNDMIEEGLISTNGKVTTGKMYLVI